MNTAKRDTLNPKPNQTKEFFCFTINNVITDDYRLAVNHKYQIVMIVDNALELKCTVLKAIHSKDDTVTFTFTSLDGSRDIVINANIYADEERDWYVLDQKNYQRFLKFRLGDSNQ